MNRFIAIAVILLSTVLLAACGRSEPPLRIGVSQCSRDDWREKMNDEICREIMLHPDVEVEIRSADDSNAKQIADIRYFKDNGFDIILAAPNEAEAITPVIKEVYESGTPVIVFDRNINGDTYTAYQGADNEGIGRAAARYARNLTGPGAGVLEIEGLRSSTPAIGRHEGFAAEADRLGLVTVAGAAGDWNYERASAVADSLLALYPDIDLVYAHNDRMAIAASEVARRRGLDVKVIGVDAAPEIGIRAVADGVIDATFLYPTEGYGLVRTALAILRGEPYKKTNILPASSAVDASNADILLLQNRSLREETDRIKLLKSQVDDYWNRYSAQTALFYAVIAVAVLLVVVLALVLRAFWQRKRHQREIIEQNRLLEQRNEQLDEATRSKLRFFTNVSHDLRTPLTLLAGPVEQLTKASNLNARQQSLVRIADRNVRVLLRLINQILDFRKYENGELQMKLSETPLEPLFNEWTDAFAEVARCRRIRLSTNINLPDDFAMAVDAEKLERVVFNLLSNAFKFTPDNGRVSLDCRIDRDNLIITVTDNGSGIPVKELSRIFDRFYQAGNTASGGSGIGLALVKAFVELHGGSVKVKSAGGKGAIFTVVLPVRHIDEIPSTSGRKGLSGKAVSAELNAAADAGATDIATPADAPVVLVIDDSGDMRMLLAGLLGQDYRVIQTDNGRDGVRLAAKFVPDLIISDVMMPDMDGLECCRRIKEEITTSHIPVLILTACTLDEQRVQGYAVGADGYLSKPFNAEVLRARCNSLIANRRRIKNLYTAAAIPLPGGDKEAASANPDVENEFYARFLDVVEKEMSNPDLSVDILAQHMGLGRSQLYRKIKALTNFSPVEILRELRLRKAREILNTTDRTISEICYETGFSTPAYFTSCYRKSYGETPTETRRRLGR